MNADEFVNSTTSLPKSADNCRKYSVISNDGAAEQKAKNQNGNAPDHSPTVTHTADHGPTVTGASDHSPSLSDGIVINPSSICRKSIESGVVVIDSLNMKQPDNFKNTDQVNR